MGSSGPSACLYPTDDCPPVAHQLPVAVPLPLTDGANATGLWAVTSSSLEKTWAVLYILFSAQVMLLLPQQTGFLLIGIFTLTAGAELVYRDGWIDGLSHIPCPIVCRWAFLFWDFCDGDGPGREGIGQQDEQLLSQIAAARIGSLADDMRRAIAISWKRHEGEKKEDTISDSAICTENLTKLYGGHRAISNINLEVREGEVFGYLGPNGAGKTTTIRTLLDFIRPSGGSASILGLDTRANSREIKRRVAYLPGDIMLYEKLTGWEALTYSANLRGGVDWRFVADLAERLECDLTLKIRSLSRGNKQKVGLVNAFMNKPELIIMDEPSSGLDPLMQQEFYRLIDEVKADGRTVFISSHIMPEVERVCDRVGIIRRGELVTVEDVSALRERALHQLEFHFSTSVPSEAFAGLPGVRDVAVNESVLTCTTIGSPDALIKAVARYEVVKLVSKEPHLEDVFLSYYGEGENHAA